jgi:transposase
MDGSDQRAMDCNRLTAARRPCACRWTRSSLDRSPPSLQWHPVDIAHRSPLEGLARTIREVPNRTPALPELGTLRGFGAGLIGAGPGSSRTRGFGSHRMFCGRDICSGQKRGRHVGKTKRGKGTKLMAIADGHGLPLAARTESASPAENTLVTATLEQRFVAELPQRLIGDKAYDSDGLDRELMEGFGTEMIAPHRSGRRAETKTQDGRSLRRFKRRWKMERFFAWLSNLRRLVVRWEYHAENFQGFIHLGCLLILLRHL